MGNYKGNFKERGDRVTPVNTTKVMLRKILNQTVVFDWINISWRL